MGDRLGPEYAYSNDAEEVIDFVEEEISFTDIENSILIGLKTNPKAILRNTLLISLLWKEPSIGLTAVSNKLPAFWALSYSSMNPI